MKIQELMAQGPSTLTDVDGKWAIDREGPPAFYVVQDSIKETDSWKNEAGRVVADSCDHQSAREGWHTVGHVSRQTPFGQGTAMGIRIEHLRPATKEQILEALKADHPHGKEFKPLSHYPSFLRNGYLTPADSTEDSREGLARLIEAKLAEWMKIAERQISILEGKEE